MSSPAASPAPLRWNAEALWQDLQPLLPGLSVEVVARIDSTNSQLMERARLSDVRRGAPSAPVREERGAYGRRAGDAQPCLLVAEQQVRGRGRMGRVWHSSVGASLTFSLALVLQPRSWSGLSLAVGVALADALEPPVPDAPSRIGLKWPNDLWLVDAPGAGRKLGGVLIETVPMGERRMAVVGVGLNVQAQAQGEEPVPHASLRELDPQASAPLALHRVARPLVQALRRFEQEGFAGFAEAYARRDLLRGSPVTTTAPEVPAGIAEGVADDGSLWVRSGAVLHRVSGGEVSVRPAPRS